MDNDPSDMLGSALARDLNGLLEFDGIRLDDREFTMSPEDMIELDITDIIVKRNEDYERTVCHVHRPPSGEYYWRHETYIVWDDGRTAWFYINIALDEADLQVKETLRTRHHELLGQFDYLIATDVVTKDDAQVMYDGILTELERITEKINETLLESDVVDEAPSLEALKGIIERIDASSPVGEAPYPEYKKLYEIVRSLRAAHYASIELRTAIVERYVDESSRRIDVAESDPKSAAPPAAMWELLDLLDKIR